MKSSTSLVLSLAYCLVGISLQSLPTSAQITPDGTTSTTVNVNGNNFEINNGDRLDDNLFHSFDEFSIPTLGSAVFNNASDIANIFSRVTGSNISNIDGLISANGTANLFLINPNGIIFGENASLNLGGSFLASTADSLLFDGDIEFSATNPQAPPLLKVNMPIGLNLGNNPGEIVNRSYGQNSAGDFVGLEVAPGKNLTLVGGNINFERGQATARGGNIELGGLSEAGTVGINDDGSLNFPEDVERANITLSNAADVDVRGTGGGSIAINAHNLNLEVGDFGRSRIRAGLTADSTSANAQAGDITITATENVAVDESFIANQVLPNGVGNAGDVNIKTGSLTLTNGGQVDASTFGRGDAGSVEITATNTITIDGEGSPSGAASTVQPGAVGNAGGVTINTSSLSLTNGGVVSASTGGQGNAGSVEITATNTITLDGESSFGSPSGVGSAVSSGAVGDAGGVTINTGSLSLTNGGRVDASTFGQGNAGSVEITATDTISIDGEDSNGFRSAATSVVGRESEGDAGGVTINTGSFSLTNGGAVSASTFGQGNAGSVEITATDTITFDGEDLSGIPSGATSLVIPGAVGNAGGVTINTGSLSLTNGGRVDASTFGRGDAGLVEITATDTITFDGESSDGFPSGATSLVISEGDAGGITINTGSLSLTNGGRVDASTFGQGNGGSVEITATDTISIDGEDSNGSRSGIVSEVVSGAVGDAGGIIINTGSLSLTNGARVDASTFGQGNAGLVEIIASDTILIDGKTLRGLPAGVASVLGLDAIGDARGVTINTSSLSLTNGGVVIASTFGQGNAGLVEINASDTILIDGEASFGSPSGIASQLGLEADGDAGGIIINTGSLSLTNGGVVSVTTGGQGNAGSVEITATNTIMIDGEDSGGFSSGVGSTVNLGAVGDAGGILINTGSLSLTNGGQVDASTFGQGDAGLVKITATDTITIDGENSDGFPSGVLSSVDEEAVGNAGGVSINTSYLSLSNGGQVNASTFGQGNAGDVTVNARESITISGVGNIFRSALSADALVSSGNGGDVNVFTNRLTINDGGTIEAGNFDSLGVFEPGTGKPGTINIQANSLSLSNQASIEAATQSEIGEGANINLTIAEDIILRNNSLVSARALENADGGNVTINASDGFIIAFPNQNNDIIANAQQGNGGRINISTQAIFGLEERRSTPPNQTNDLDASSEFGLQGEITINTPEADPTKGLIELPESVGDASDQISQNPCERGRSSKFIITGKGGVRPSPTETLSSGEVWKDVQLPSQFTKNSANSVQQSNTNTERIVEATAWIINEEGILELVAEESSDTRQDSCR